MLGVKRWKEGRKEEMLGVKRWKEGRMEGSKERKKE